MVSSAANRKRFIESTLAFLRKYSFDGLDLDWEYPSVRGGKPSDKQNLVLLVQVRESVIILMCRPPTECKNKNLLKFNTYQYFREVMNDPHVSCLYKSSPWSVDNHDSCIHVTMLSNASHTEVGVILI